jgi:ABC-2 type transport system ATP-binding protein
VPIIECEGLTKRYGPVLAIDELSVSVEPGVIGLVGANGAGKSTLIKILLGLLPPTAGTARVLGHDVLAEGIAIRERVGYMPEHDCLPLDMNATELVAHLAQVSGLPRSAARERTAETLRHVGLFEERYREMRGYSTGMKQRVKLAQALVHDPRLMLLDEPTNGLDPEGRDDMLALVRRVGHEFGISIVICSHLLGEIERVCDSLIVIDGGRLVRSGPVADFTSQTGLLAVEVDGEVVPFAARLRAAGLEVRVDRREAVIEGGQGDSHIFNLVRDTAVDLGVGLVRIEQRRRRLEDLFERRTGVRDDIVF